MARKSMKNQEEEEEEEEHSDDWETEFGYHAELCGHLGHWNDYTIGIFVGYGESDADVCSEYGLSIGRHHFFLFRLQTAIEILGSYLDKFRKSSFYMEHA